MHPCLEREDVLDRIASHIVLPKRDLLAMALTCHAFLGPATALLWVRLFDLEPLMELIPAHRRGAKSRRLVRARALNYRRLQLYDGYGRVL